ncbi:MAG: hypothetical protein ACYDH6_11485 [Acidimicrobiales bacterium]
MNRVKVGFFSMSGASAFGDDRPYLRWHQLDHMPEQYQIAGLLKGERWVSTPACDAARAVQSDDLAPVRSVVQYLMTDPVQQTIDDFLQLGRRLAELGRYPERVASHLLGAFHLLEMHAAARVLVSPEAVAFRPNLGVYVIVERPTGDTDAWLRDVHTTHVPALLDTPGVAGVWSFATSSLWSNPAWTPGHHRITVCYLDQDPAGVGDALRPVVAARWRDAPVTPALAAPFESMVRWEWDRFGPSAELDARGT